VRDEEGKVEVLWGYGNTIIIYLTLPYLAKDWLGSVMGSGQGDEIAEETLRQLLPAHTTLK
jgi:hypothetical protein